MRRDRATLFDAPEDFRELPVPDYVAFDLETTGLSPDDDEILEVAFVRFSSGRPVERWSTLLNPGRRIPLKALRLTHIDESEILKSPAFHEVVDKIGEIAGGLPLVGHNSPFDTAFLQRRIDGFPKAQVYDTLELSRIVVPGLKSYKLTDLARELGVVLTDAHRAYDDAEVSGIIFSMIQERALAMKPHVKRAVTSIMGDSWEPRHLFSFVPPGPLRLSLFTETAPAASIAAAGQTAAFDSSGEMARAFLDHLQRESATCAIQIPLVPAIARAIASAARDYAASTGQGVLLAGFPEASLPQGIDAVAVPEDFVCLRKLDFAARLAGEGSLEALEPEEKRFLAAVMVWADETRTGSLTELQIAGLSFGVAAELACPRLMECRSSCPLSGECHYLLAEARAEGLVAHLARLDRVIASSRRFDRAVVWGGHDLSRTWQYVEERTDLSLVRESLSKGVFAPSLLQVFNKLWASAAKDASTGLASSGTRELAATFAAEAREAISASRLAVQERFSALSPDSSGAGETWGDPPLVSRDLHRIEAASAALAMFANPSSEEISLVEQSYGDDTRGPYLVKRAIWPARAAVAAIEAKARAVTLLSDVAMEAAASDGGCHLLAGGPVSATELDCARGMCPGDLLVATVDARVPTTGPAFTEHVSTLLKDLALSVRKGLLALFPSRAQIKDVHALLSPALEAEGIVVYAQGVDGGRRVVEHLEEDDAVVLVTAAGLPADDEPVPSCLVLVKVPFPPPNLMDDARRKDASRRGVDGFVEVNVRPSSLLVRGYAARMTAAGGHRAIVLADPRLAPGQSKWAGEFHRAFNDFRRESGGAQYLIERVSGHLSGNP